MDIKIKYEKLSDEVKKEINKYHSELVKSGMAYSLESSIDEWFEKYFDSWFVQRFESNSNNIRKHPRISIELPVKIIETLLDSNDDGTTGDIFGTIQNISRGGIYFNSSRKFEKSSIIKIVIDLSNIDKDLKSVEALAMVMRVDEIQEDSYGIGVMFSSVYDDEKKTLDMFILKNLSYFLYKE